MFLWIVDATGPAGRAEPAGVRVQEQPAAVIRLRQTKRASDFETRKFRRKSASAR
jgi:hypothetical protein